MANELRHIFDVQKNTDKDEKFSGYLDCNRKEIAIYSQETASEVCKIQQITVSDQPPENPYVGQLWVDTDC